MRQTPSLALTFLLTLQLAPTAFGAQSVASQIITMPRRARTETLVDAATAEHRTAFDADASVKRLDTKWPAKHKALIGALVGVLVAVGMAAVISGIVAAVALRAFKTHPS